jgi:hypothetical protein
MATAGNSGTHRVPESCKQNIKITVGYAGSIKHSGKQELQKEQKF